MEEDEEIHFETSKGVKVRPAGTVVNWASYSIYVGLRSIIMNTK